MKSIITFLLLLGCIFSVKAQNWQCVNPAAKVYFTNSIHYLRGMRIDSVRTVGTSTVYYPFHSLRGKWRPYNQVPPTVALDSMGGSWMGSKIIQEADGTTLFDNIWRDTIVIRTRAGLGQSWIFYNDTTSLYFEATVASLDTMTIDGAPDSVKRINLQAKIAGVPVQDTVNYMHLLLSKNHGFYTAIDFIAFPYREPGSNVDFNQGFPFDYYLAAANSNPESLGTFAGACMFNRIPFDVAELDEIFHYSVGDTWQTSIKLDDLSGAGRYDTTIETDSVMQVINAGPIIGYITKITTAKLDYTQGQPQPVFTLDTVTRTMIVPLNTKLQYLDSNKMPEEWYNPNIYYYNPADTSLCRRSRAYIIDSTGIIQHDAHAVNFEPCSIVSKFKSGVGESYYNAECLNGPGAFLSLLITYMKHGNVGCGPRSSLAVPDRPQQFVPITIYPIPANDQLTIIRAAQLKVQQVNVFNIAGQLVFASPGNSSKTIVPTAGLPDGTYLLEVISNNAAERKIFSVMH